ncbi:MAG: 4-hydroxy-tetrahydrodipicolinate synthase [Acidaminococcaceae bacterium]|jgi:4-hydroxy-tetrahydrodipicolinate synthase|nr:4-hydroxy-tetrahydrodipicolinate synthase [Acidaminococcaceae bacterium]
MKYPFFGRLVTAMVTFFNEDGSLNANGSADFAEWLSQNGSDAILLTGSTGEAATMTLEERSALWSAVVKKINHKVPIIAGTGSNNTAASIETTKIAESLGVDAILLVGPYYNKPTQEGYFQHFKAIADATKLPVILYNIPGRTGSNILPATIARIAKACPNVIGVKEAAGNVSQVAELYRILPKDFSIYSGDDGLVLPFMAVGACGVISVLSNLGGSLQQELMAAYLNGNVQKAKELNAIMIPQEKSLFTVTNPIPVKAAVTLCTPFNAGPCRMPLCPMTPEENTKFLAALEASGLKK